MSSSGLSRRSFITTSLKAGLGAAGAGLALGGPLSLLGDAAASASPDGATVGGSHSVFGGADPSESPSGAPLLTGPGAPTGHRHYVSRPDLRPPVVDITAVSGFPYSSSQPGYIFCAPRTDDGGPYPTNAQAGLMILSLTGEVIWFKPLNNTNLLPFNFRVQTYKGAPVLTWFQGGMAGGVGYSTSGNCVIYDNRYSQVTTVEAVGYQTDLHEFLLTPNGTALISAYQPGVAGPGGSTIVVGHAQEVDVATGDLAFDWACYPAIPTSQSYVGTTGDYFHLNSIDLWPGTDGHLLVSARDTSTVYLVNRLTKAIIWRLGGKSNSFAMGRNTPFYFQHDARALTDGSGVSLFDDASQPSPETQSSGKVLSLSKNPRQATLRHQYFHTDRVVDTPREGNVQLLANGGHMIGWGAAPYFSIFRASGNAVNAEMALDGRFPANVESYRVFNYDWVGNPAQDELSLVVHATGGSGHFTGWVSWNGATDVAAWRMNAGPSYGSLEVITTVKKTSFETPINFTRNGAKVFRAAALDSKGNVISRTSVVEAT